LSVNPNEILVVLLGKQFGILARVKEHAFCHDAALSDVNARILDLTYELR
jgi:hypothetical protein